MKKLFTYRNARRVVLIMMIMGVIALILADSVTGLGSNDRIILIWFGICIFVISLLILFIGIKCPACGAHFFRSALFLSECPVCGYKFSDFYLGKMVEPPQGWESKEINTGDRLKPHK